ncbi:MAG: hypothetical protein QOI96_377 [Verrucomicrobiota bacterium]
MDLELLGARRHLLNLFEVVVVIGGHAQDSVRRERGMDISQEIEPDDAPLMMFPLFPRIGKQKVKHFD